MDLLASLIPPDLSPAFTFTLIALSFLTSGMTAAIGLGGGVALLAVMASAIPMAVLIPVHGVIQLGSNAGRMVVQARHIDRAILLYIAIGALAGAWAGGHMVVRLPDAPLKIALAVFVLWSIWGPKPSFSKLPRSLLVLAGFITTILTMFFGATGPFVGAIISPLTRTRHAFVGTFAACMTLQHLIKVIVFGFLGFAFAPWLAFMVAMIATGFVGTLAGSALLGRMPESAFRAGFRTAMTVLALNLVLQGVGIDLI